MDIFKPKDDDFYKNDVFSFINAIIGLIDNDDLDFSQYLALILFIKHATNGTQKSVIELHDYIEAINIKSETIELYNKLSDEDNKRAIPLYVGHLMYKDGGNYILIDESKLENILNNPSIKSIENYYHRLCFEMIADINIQNPNWPNDDLLIHETILFQVILDMRFKYSTDFEYTNSEDYQFIKQYCANIICKYHNPFTNKDADKLNEQLITTYLEIVKNDPNTAFIKELAEFILESNFHNPRIKLNRFTRMAFIAYFSNSQVWFQFEDDDATQIINGAILNMEYYEAQSNDKFIKIKTQYSDLENTTKIKAYTNHSGTVFIQIDETPTPTPPPTPSVPSAPIIPIPTLRVIPDGTKIKIYTDQSYTPFREVIISETATVIETTYKDYTNHFDTPFREVVIQDNTLPTNYRFFSEMMLIY